MIGAPTKEQAYHFALMLASGMPAQDAIVYFLSPEQVAADTSLPRVMMAQWLHSEEVGQAVLALQRAPWQTMDPEERIRFAIDKHYNELAYYLYSHNYSDLMGAEKAKADTCRQVLEMKLAGMAGRVDALSAFWNDVMSGKVKLIAGGTPLPVPSNHPS